MNKAVLIPPPPKALSPVSRGTLRVALIGCGAIAEQMHLPVLAGHEGIELAALVDRDEKRARKLADGYEVKMVCRDADDLAEGSIDAAILATPPFHHAPGSIALMRRGIHVLVEKPMALNLAEAEEMCRVAEEEGVTLAVGYFRRLYPSIRLLKGMLESGPWGRALSFSAEAGGMYNWRAATLGNMRKELAGGGVLIDFGSHVLDLLFALFDEPAEVLSYTDNALGGIEADCEISLRMSHHGEPIEGTVALARVRNLQNHIRVECERATLEFGFNERHRVRVVPRGQVPVDSLAGEPRKFELQAGWSQENEEISWYDTFRLQIDDWMDAIQHRREPLLSGRSALPTVRLIEACYQQPRAMEEPWVWAGIQEAGGTVHAHPSPLSEGEEINGKVPPVTPMPRRRVLLTGASGFIGSRVAEIMHLRDGWDVRAVVHNPGNASRLARLPVEMVQGDLKTEEGVKRLVDGCEAVVHCAVGTAWGQRKEIFEVTVGGTRRLAEASLAAGVKRLVHLSTISVFGDEMRMTGTIDETAPARPIKGSEYGESKLQAEVTIQELVRRGLSAVILRPARVYGPYSRIFVARPIQAIAERRFRWLGNPDVPADLIYVDNVVEAILRSLAAPEAVGRGEVFAISDGDDLTWRQFYQHLADGLGLTLDAPVIRRERANGRAAQAWWNPGAWLRAGKTVITSSEFKSLGRRVLETKPVGTLPRWGLESFPALERAARRMVGADGSLPIYRREAEAANDWVEMGSGGALVSIDKARRLLGFDPLIKRDEALEFTVDWIKHARLVG
jgi:predicted dehydrogenase/nucleoside-diphosphate-sugar epimerase